jgi:predicted nucleotidyltransferase
MNIYDEFFSVIKKLNDAEIKYAVVGGIALSFYVEPRYTKDIDFLVLSDRIDDLKSILREMGYKFESPSWTFKNTAITLHRLSKIQGTESMTIDILEGKERRFEEIIQNAIKEDTKYGKVCVASKDDLIWMKQIRNSQQDIADIEALNNVKD